jgi:acetyl-CoA/propionyl-CoA carboxylase biotin carboxyl carrier protein
VTEETTGVDLVRMQFRIAEGQALDFPDPEPRGHSFEFRINAEDPGRGFLPAPGTVTRFVPPLGPGVRVDAGVETGSVVDGAFDSLLAKVIVSGADRQQALDRAARALAEMQVDGVPTLLPFHRKVVADPAFTAAPFTVHNRWIETEFHNDIEPASPATPAEEADPWESIVIEVDGRRVRLGLPAGLTLLGRGAAAAAPTTPVEDGRDAAAPAHTSVPRDGVLAPMPGTIVKIAVMEGDPVEQGDLVVVLEAMKMEQPIYADRAGTVEALSVHVGDFLRSGTVICRIVD